MVVLYHLGNSCPWSLTAISKFFTSPKHTGSTQTSVYVYFHAFCRVQIGLESIFSKALSFSFGTMFNALLLEARWENAGAKDSATARQANNTIDLNILIPIKVSWLTRMLFSLFCYWCLLTYSKYWYPVRQKWYSDVRGNNYRQRLRNDVVIFLRDSNLFCVYKFLSATRGSKQQTCVQRSKRDLARQSQ